MQAPEFDQQLALAATPDHNALDTVPTGNGVFLFRDNDKRPLMLGVAANLRASLRAKLFEQTENPLDQKRVKLAGVAREVAWKRTANEFERFLVYGLHARDIYPTTYRRQLPFSTCWFITIDLRTRFPRFEAKKTPSSHGETIFGPLLSRRDADRMIRLLEDAFDLCRYHDVLTQSPNGQACAYYDMGRCPAPCDGTVSMQRYHDSIGAATAFLRGDADGLAPVKARMKTAAAATQFELAQVYKKIAEEAGGIFNKPAFKHMLCLNDATWMVVLVDNSRRRRLSTAVLRGYGFCRGALTAFAAGKATEFDTLVGNWRAALAAFMTTATLQPVDLAITTALLSRYLFKPDQRMVVIVPEHRMNDDGWIRTCIHQRLLDKEKK